MDAHDFAGLDEIFIYIFESFRIFKIWTAQWKPRHSSITIPYAVKIKIKLSFLSDERAFIFETL